MFNYFSKENKEEERINKDGYNEGCKGGYNEGCKGGCNDGCKGGCNDGCIEMNPLNITIRPYGYNDFNMIDNGKENKEEEITDPDTIEEGRLGQIGKYTRDVKEDVPTEEGDSGVKEDVPTEEGDSGDTNPTEDVVQEDSSIEEDGNDNDNGNSEVSEEDNEEEDYEEDNLTEESPIEDYNPIEDIYKIENCGVSNYIDNYIFSILSSNEKKKLSEKNESHKIIKIKNPTSKNSVILSGNFIAIDYYMSNIIQNISVSDEYDSYEYRISSRDNEDEELILYGVTNNFGLFKLKYKLLSVKTYFSVKFC